MDLRGILKFGALGLIAYGLYGVAQGDGIGLPSLVPAASGAGASSTSYAGQAAIKQREGLRLSAYRDGNGYSIGYGHHITGTDGLNSNSTISQAKAQQLFAADLASAEAVIRSSVAVPMTQGQFDALADFVYNRGAGNFHNSGIAQAMNAGDMAQAASLLQNFDNGTVLASRRAANAAQFMA
jgi:lysozyme